MNDCTPNPLVNDAKDAAFSADIFKTRQPQPSSPRPKPLSMDSERGLGQMLANENKLDFVPGLPNCVDIASTLERLHKYTSVYQDAAKNTKLSKKSRRNREELVFRCFANPVPTRQMLELNQKQLVSLSAISTRKHRLMVLGDLVKKGTVEHQPEMQWINHFARSAKLSTVKFEIDDTMTSRRHFWPSVMEKADKHPMALAAWIVPRSGDEWMTAQVLISRVIEHEILPRAYSEVIEDGPLAREAAACVFGVASLSGTRYLLDWIYAHNKDAFYKHYNGLVFANCYEWIQRQRYKARAYADTESIQAVLAAESSRPVEWYEPPTPNVTDEEFTEWLEAIKVIGNAEYNSALVTGEIDRLKGAGATIEDRDAMLAEMAMTGPMLEEVAENLRSVAATATRLSSEAIPRHFSRAFDSLAECQAILQSTFHEGDDHQALDATKADDLIAAMTRRLAKDAETPEAPLDADQLADLLTACGDLKIATDDLVAARETIEDELKDLVGDPIGNREGIQACYNRLSELDPKPTLDDLERLWERLMAVVSHYAESKRETHQADATTTHDDDPLSEVTAELDSAREQIEALEKELASLNQRFVALEAQKDTLTHRLADKTEKLSGDLTTEVRDLTQKMLARHNLLTTEQCLKLLKALYPEVEILPSAWESALESAAFKPTDRLWGLLNTLATTYLNDLNNGIPDCEARKRFPGQTYAANESETTASNKRARAAREFTYQGEKHVFEKHLRIGVADDRTRTIRVHFEIFEGRLVIAFCGQHCILN
ncbi:MAG: hypothetical protein AWU57_507 [Marinobacter sp. T13-3]|nr:MAG: hypothetical protein AWU57_507 [Marinobacter sp. T13-3]